MNRDLQPHELIERSIIKKFRKTIWNPFTLAVRQYQLIQPGDKIAVCIHADGKADAAAPAVQRGAV